MSAPLSLPQSSPVSPTGDRMCFRVQSSRIPEWNYIVDLTGEEGRSTCTCIDWAVRRGPAIKAGGVIGTREVMCRHVIAARNYFLNGLLASMAKSETER